MENGKYKLETVKAVCEVVKEEYLAVDRGISLMVAKGQTLATVASVFTVVYGLVKPDAPCALLIWHAALFLAVVSTIISLLVIIPAKFPVIKYQGALAESELRTEAPIVLVKLAKTYDEAISGSRPKQAVRSTWLSVAISILIVSSILYFLSLGLNELHGGNMSEKKPNPSVPTPSTTPPTPKEQPDTKSYGTDYLKKSGDPSNTLKKGKQ